MQVSYTLIQLLYRGKTTIREIVYQDKLYDIITIKHHGDKVTITVASDDQEMALKKEIRYYVRS